MKRLEEEEKKAREMLEEKMKLQSLLHQLKEDLEDAKTIARAHRQEIIDLEIKKSQLLSLEVKLKGELESLTEENDFYIKKNAEFELDNTRLNKEIHATI
jgi:hypothetical protein